MLKIDKCTPKEVFYILISLTMIAIPIAAWFNHVITCFQSEQWGFLIAGAIFFPVAICHGIYLWF